MIPLHKAVAEGQIELILKLIKEGADINEKDDQSWTPMHLACQNGQLEVIKLLRKHKARIDCREKDKLTPLHIACQNGHLEVVQYLCDIKKSYNEKTIHGETALHLAAENGHLEIVKHLYLKGAKIDIATENQNKTPLELALLNRHSEVTKILIEYSVLENYLQETIFSILKIAIETLQVDIVKCLLEKKTLNYKPLMNQDETYLHYIVTNCQDEDERSLNMIEFLGEHFGKNFINQQRKTDSFTALHLAVLMNKLNMIKSLTEIDASVNLTDESKITPLNIAVANENFKIVGCLLNHGAINTCVPADEVEKIPLMVAIMNDNPHMVKVLLAYKAKVDFVAKLKNNGGLVSPLTLAMKCKKANHMAIINYLIEHKADLNFPTALNRTALHQAVIWECEDVLPNLIQNGGNINAKDKNGKTPLHLALERNHLNFAKKLINLGADVNAKDSQNWTPMHIACQNGNLEIVKLLFEKKAIVDCQQNSKKTPLHLASRNGHLELVKFLLQFTTSVNDRTVHGSTALHMAVEKGHLEIVKLLLSKGAMTDVKTDQEGITPFMLAIGNKQIEVIKLFMEQNIMKKKTMFDMFQNAQSKFQLDMFKLLPECGMPFKVLDFSDYSLIHHIITNGLDNDSNCLEMIQILLKNCDTINAKDANGKTLLHLALEKSKLKFATKLINLKIDVNAVDNQKWTPMHLACQSGFLKIVKLLFVNKATIDCQQLSKKTPLHLASRNGHLEVVKFLCGKMTSLDNKTVHGSTALHMAVEKGHLRIVKHLLSKGAMIDVRTKKDEITPLMLAVHNKQLEMIKAFAQQSSIWKRTVFEVFRTAKSKSQLDLLKCLIDCEISVNCTDFSNQSFIHYIVTNGWDEDPNCLEMLKLLSKHCEKSILDVGRSSDNSTALDLASVLNKPKMFECLIGIGVTVKSKKSPLMMAIENKNLSVVKLLLKKGVDVNLGDEENIPLVFATKNNDFELVKLLLEHEANEKYVPHDNKEKIPLIIAIKNNNYEIVKILLEYGAIEKFLNDKCHTSSLVLAIKIDNPKIVELLLLYGANADSKSVFKNGEKLTLLIYTIKCNSPNHLAVIKHLLEFKADANAQIDNNKTALHQAVLYNSESVLEILVENGANINAKDSNGKTPIYLAIESQKPNFLLQLVKLGADLNYQDNQNKTPLHICVDKGYIDLAKILLEHKANTNIQDSQKKTPIHHAIASKNLDFVKLLAENGANLEQRSFKDKNILEYAKSIGHRNIIQVIVQQMMKNSEAKVENDEQQGKRTKFDDCIVCFNTRYDFHVMIPCGHAKTCEACCLKIMNMPNSDSRCPVCRVMITSYMRAFH